MILDAIEWGLKIGCKSSLVEMLQSKGFSRLMADYANLETRFSPDTDEGIALRAGHLNMGRLFNTLPEADAIEEAKSCAKVSGSSGDFSVMVRCFGEALVKTAAECLPPDIMAMAREWKATDSSRQIEIARQLYSAFRSETQESAGGITMQSARKRIERKLRKKDDERNILPALYGTWDKKTCLANCQGKMQMLTAFGRLAGARVLCAGSIRQSRRELEEFRRTLIGEIVADLRARGLEDADAGLSESIAASQVESSAELEESFHVCVALELRDGRWVLIDPHGMAWGVLSDVWDLGNTYRILSKYAVVLPGLQIIRHDHGESKRVLEYKLGEARDLLSRSKRMEETIRASATSVMDLIDAIVASEDLDILMRNERAEAGCESFNLSNPIVRRYAVTVLVMGGGKKMWDIGRMIDPNFLEARIRSWVTFYHANAANLFKDQLSDQGKLLHPVCEFGMPEYHIAIAAINSLTWRFGRRPSIVVKFFLDYSFDQVSLHNALFDSEIGQAAARTLKALPFVHSASKWKLERWF